MMYVTAGFSKYRQRDVVNNSQKQISKFVIFVNFENSQKKTLMLL